MVKPRRVCSDEKKPDNFWSLDPSTSGMYTATGSKNVCTYSKSNLRLTVKSISDAPELNNPETSELSKTASESVHQKPVPFQVATRSSGRLSKRPRRDISPPSSPPKKSLKDIKTCTPEAKTRRHWELWSAEDKDTFFEALSEFGKDFDAIQNVYAVRHKKRGGHESLIKTKDQIRHFYYRNWHKISKYLTDTNDVNKEVLELYGLINYGHLRKRIGSKLNEKNGQKLNELINRGAALVKVKGKNQRLRTPLCRALKKLNNLDDEDEKVKEQVPGRFVLELYPHNNAAWTRVQTVSQNPRLRIKVKPDCRISTIFDFLNRKWKTDRLRMKEGLKGEEEVSQELRLLPPAHCKLMPFEVKPAPTPVRVDVALINYKENVKRGSCSVSPTQSKRSQKGSAIKPDAGDDTLTANDDSSSVTGCVTGCVTIDENADMQTDCDTSLDESCTDIGDDVRLSDSVGDQTFLLQTNKINDHVEKLRSGITRDTAEDVTIGQLCLMMGDPQKMVLQYEWTETVKAPDIVGCNQRLTNMLRRLIHIATTEFIDLSKSRPQPMPLDKSRPQSMPLDPSSPPCSAPPCSLCGARPGSRRGGDDTPPGVKSTKLGRSPAGRQLKRNMAPAKTPPAKSDTATASVAPGVAPLPVKAEVRLCQPDTRLAMGDHNTCTTDGVFKMPTLLPARVQKQTDIFFNRCNNKRMARNVRRPLVVQRTLLPKAQVPTRQIMTLTLLPDVPQLAQKGSFMPVVSQPQATYQQPVNMASISKILPFHVGTGSGDTLTCSDILHRAVSQANIQTASDVFPASSAVSLAMNMNVAGLSADKNVICGTDSLLSSCSSSVGGLMSGLISHTTNQQTSRLFNGSTTSIHLHHTKDTIPIDISPTDLGESSGRLLELVQCTDFNVLLDTSEEKSSCREAGTSPPSDKTILSLEPSPTKPGVPILGPEEQWLNGEDFSLSSFLCESPLKRVRPSSSISNHISQLTCCENSRDSVISKLDVDSTLQCMMNESSLDYASKFADLAAQIAAQDTPLLHPETRCSGEDNTCLSSHNM